MKKFIYRSLDIDIGNRIMDECDKIGIEYDIYNMDELVMDEAAKIEFGLTEEDWDKFPAYK